MESDFILAAIIALLMMPFALVIGCSGGLYFMQAWAYGKISGLFGKNLTPLFLIPAARCVPLAAVFSGGKRAWRVIWTVVLLYAEITLIITLLLVLPVRSGIHNYIVDLDQEMRYIGEGQMRAMWCIVGFIVLAWRITVSAGQLTVYLRCYKKWVAVLLGIFGIVLPVAPFAFLVASHRRADRLVPAKPKEAE